MNRAKSFNLADLFGITVATVPADREALVCGARRVTYRELHERARKLALWLRARGIGAGDTVGIHAYNCVEFMEATFAAYMLRAAPVTVNYRYTAEEARYIYADAQLKALVYGAAVEATVAGALDAAHGLRALARIGSGAPVLAGAVDYEHALAQASGTLDDIERTDDDITVLYTGGTTGNPKGVIWPHKALFFAALGGGGAYNAAGPIERPEELAERVRQSAPIRQLSCGPLMHGAGMWGTTIGLLGGMTVFLSPWPDFVPEYLLNLICEERINVFSLVGDAMALPLLDALKAWPGRWDLGHVFAVTNGGAMLSEHMREALRPYLAPQAVMLDSMASSETGTSGAGTKPAGGGLLRLAPGPSIAVAVDGARFARPGETGILVRMGHLPLGYLGDARKSAATFVTIDGRRCAISGDSARLEVDGSITVFGRDSQCINTGGEKVFTEEVEEVLRSCDSVCDAVVVGVPDPRWGQKVVAVIALRSGVPENWDALRVRCRQKLAGYKVPKDAVFVQAVQRSPSGKADYRWARMTAEQRLAPN